jgi:hypothetical protein
VLWAQPWTCDAKSTTRDQGKTRNDRPQVLVVDPPPMKWSDSKYGFATEEDCNGEEAQT